MSVTRVIKCTCVSPTQDSWYGTGNRVHNPLGAKNGNKFRCTVCNTTHEVDQPAPKAKKDVANESK
jgi:hypothetical protein